MAEQITQEEGLENQVTSTEPVETQNTEQNTQEKTAVEDTKREYVSRKDVQSKAEQAFKEIERLNKENAWLRSTGDRRDSEYKKQFERINPLLADYQKYQEAAKQKEMEALAKSNPAEFYKRSIEDAKKELQNGLNPQALQQEVVAGEIPFQEKVQYLQKNYEPEVLQAVAPAMDEVLARVQKLESEGSLQKGATKILENNPDALLSMAIGERYLAEYRKSKQVNDQGKKNQERAQQFAKGTAKPTGGAPRQPSFDTMSDKELDQAMRNWRKSNPK